MEIPSSLPARYRHIALGDVISTNMAAQEHFDKGDPGNLWITARQQAGGKGSRGRNWVSLPGNLYTSLLLCTKLPPAQLANLTFVTALALYEALSNHLPEKILSLKWPNDVLVKDKKISGILLENYPRQNGSSGIIIGVGINCNSHPDDPAYKATNLLAQGVKLDPLDLFYQFATSVEKYLELWDNGRNFNAIRKLWLERARGIGSRIIVKMPSRKLSGIFEKINDQGLLLLRTDDNVQHQISTADIFFTNHSQKSA